MTRLLKRFLVSTSLRNRTVSEKILLTPEETHHLKDVLHLEQGHLCFLFDREGHEFVSRVERFLPDARSEMQLIESAPKKPESKLKLTVAQAIPQDRKMDEIVRAAAELGIFKLIPLVTERTIVRIEEKRFEHVRARWERIAEQTAKQSYIQKIPEITALTTFNDLCTHLSEYDQSFLFHLSEISKPIRDLNLSANESLRLLVVVGPEGGFSQKEVEQAKVSGMKLVKIESGILKTDTAFVTIAGFFTVLYA